MPESGSSDQEINGKLKRNAEVDSEVSKKRKRKSRGERSAKANGSKSLSKRRHSVSKPARDPRDGAPTPESPGEDDSAAIRSPSPVIDFDGLSKPSKHSMPSVRDYC
jgi:GTP cyclohydrolase I